MKDGRLFSAGVIGLGYFLIGLAFGDVGVMSEESRNVREYGAKGDGVTNDTEAFIHALQQGRNTPAGSKKPVSVYVPAGRYLIHSTLILWSRTQMFGDWNNRPTLVLGEGSKGFQDAENPTPFLVTAGGYNMPEDTTDWRTRTGQINGSTNNSFDIIFRDINLEVGAHNPGAWALFWWCAQQTSLRNVNVDAGACLGCLSTNAWGGGSTIADCRFRGGQTGYASDATSMEFFRDCTFCDQTRRAAYINGVYMYTFQHVFFVDTAPVELGPGLTGVVNFLNCSFQHIDGPGIVDQYRHSRLHLENATFDDLLTVPRFLTGSGEGGRIKQWTSAKVVKAGEEISGTDQSLSQAICPLSLDGRPTPRPGIRCICVKSLGAVGDGIHDDTTSITGALRRYSELFFPPGIYRVRAPLRIGPGQRLFGCGVQVSNIELDSESADFPAGSDRAFVTVYGNKQRGVAIYGLGFINNAPGGKCLVWKGDPSSVVMDSTFENGGKSSFCPMNIVAGGGFFEELWNPAGDSRKSQGVRVTASGPVWLYSFQPEHYSEYAIAIDGAKYIAMMNVELENSAYFGKPGTELQISNSTHIYLYGIVGGSWRTQEAPDVVRITDSQNVALWNISALNVPCLVRDLSFGVPKTYGPAGSGTNAEQAAVLAGFIK
jgi:hypothetical protein